MPAIILDLVRESTTSVIALQILCNHEDRSKLSPRQMGLEYGIVDLFAGPGGLGEGFASLRTREGRSPFGIAFSAEMDGAAHQTLTLRAFLRAFEGGIPKGYASMTSRDDMPDWSTRYPAEWQRATREARRLTLGTRDGNMETMDAVRKVRRRFGDRTLLIGGPPCQAYSLVGRARNRGVVGYDPKADHRHYLYREYVSVLKALMPAVFVMENVRGMLSARVGRQRIFDLIHEDLTSVNGPASYELIPFVAPETRDLLGSTSPDSFLVHAEKHGVPQSRHRVFLIGMRRDVASATKTSSGLVEPTNDRRQITVEDMLSGMPRLRSGLSNGRDSSCEWRREVGVRMRRIATLLSKRKTMDWNVADQAARAVEQHQLAGHMVRRSTALPKSLPTHCGSLLREWIERPGQIATFNHETRSHMVEDLARYFFCASFAKGVGRSPRASEFPKMLHPEHINWSTGDFQDRFRVQVSDRPSSTITSHISKDGHYYIHPDAAQCRSLTVREAARLQTFPDDYFFMGTRTQQYVQVGNAVPPFLANRIALEVLTLLEGSEADVGFADQKTPKQASERTEAIPLCN